MNKYVILNQSGELAYSSEGAVHDSMEQAEEAVKYLQDDYDGCGLGDVSFTIHEAEMTIGKKVRTYAAVTA